jgi:hypothetical protein
MSEHQLYEKIARYLQMYYPDAIYRFDLAADLKLTAGQASKHKRIHPRRGYPDLFIAEPAKGCHGLFIELKREGTRLKKKDGTWASAHLEEQNEVLNQLQKKGYAAYFAVGFEEAKQIIDDYLGENYVKNDDCIF